MPQIATGVTREIIKDFAKEIQKRRAKTARPSTEVINFRDDKLRGTERTVWQVPIDLLRYRKDNGRIASDILDHERKIALLDEKDDQAQEIIRGFLEKKDPERTEVLVKSIAHGGQQQPAIITFDGFLINGNRRKMVMDRLSEENPNNEDFQYMKVVILPGEDEEGGCHSPDRPDRLIAGLAGRHRLCPGRSCQRRYEQEATHRGLQRKRLWQRQD